VEASAQALADARRGHPLPVEVLPIWGMDSVARLMKIGTLGARIDGGGPTRGLSPRLHPDAEVVMGAIDRIRDRRQAGLVLTYARAGDRPSWSTGAQTLVPVPAPEGKRGAVRHMVTGEWQAVPTHSEYARFLKSRGHPIVDAHGRSLVRFREPGQTFRTLDDGTRQAFVKHCPVEPWPSDDWIRSTNQQYADWHAGMMALLSQLLGTRLQDHAITGFRAPAIPWA
jgi:hypothetical protein